jgi:hypothetical protein
MTVAMMMLGFAPGAASPCCKNDGSHSCCAPAATVQAGCCDRTLDANAVAPSAQGDTVVTARASCGAEIAVLIAPERAFISRETHLPPVTQAPPLILRI